MTVSHTSTTVIGLPDCTSGIGFYLSYQMGIMLSKYALFHIVASRHHSFNLKILFLGGAKMAEE